MYARSPLRAGLRAEVELWDLQLLVSGEDDVAQVCVCVCVCVCVSHFPRATLSPLIP